MAYDNNQEESALPTGSETSANRKSSNLLPRYFRTPTNNKFLYSTLDQFLNPGTVQKISAFYGRKTAKAFVPNDSYIEEVSDDRQNYQLEPVVVRRDNLNNVVFHKDYIDYINQIKSLGGNVDNHSVLNAQEYYSWNPNIDWDKFVNFREYYWLTYGPDPITITGLQQQVQSTYTVTLSDNLDNYAYLLTPDGQTVNATIILYRGITYRFEINTPGLPFTIKTARTLDEDFLLDIPSVTPSVTQTFVVTSVVNPGTPPPNNIYQIDGVNYPVLTLIRGGVYTFDQSNASNVNHQIAFKDSTGASYTTNVVTTGTPGQPGAQTVLTVANNAPSDLRYYCVTHGNGMGNIINVTGDGVSDQNIEQGVMTFVVDANTPDTLYYVAANDINAYGLIQVANIEENSEIDVEKEIIGKKDFTLNTGMALSNGMKVNFKGNVTPVKYAQNDWYVEGVGESIQLINEQELAVPNDIADENLDQFDDAEGFDRATYDIDDTAADQKDYITIKKNSLDRNPWSRANKWTHKSVLQAVATYNGVPLNVDETLRAKRPIIEFDAGLKLHRFGSFAKQHVDVVDTFTTDVFSNIEGATGYNVDGVDLVDGMRILVTADTDILVKNRIFQVNIINFGGDGDPTNKQIALTEPTDSLPLENEVVLILNGQTNQGKMFYYNGVTWQEAQNKTTVNQPPLFDVFDDEGDSFSNAVKYFSTNFLGNKVFSYRVGTGTADTELGFALSYRNVNNVGDIVYDFNLLKDSFNYQLENEIVDQSTDVGFLKQYSDRTTFENVHGWTKAESFSKQMVIRQYLGSEQTNDFAVDVYDRSGTLSDLVLKVYVDNKLLNANNYDTVSINDILYVQLDQDLNSNQSVILKTHSSAVKNSNGYYEIPINLESNPLNANLNDFTFGEVVNHVDTIIEQLDSFVGINPGANNLRDLGNLTAYGTKFVQHSAPINLALYHITEKQNNVIKSVAFAQKEYDKFKKTFLQVAENSGFSGTTREHVDEIMNTINSDKNNNMPFYFSDMIPYGAAKKLSFTVFDDSNIFFALSQGFSMSTLSTKAVQVYLNDEQLLHGTDYTFNTDNFCVISKALVVNDVVEIFEYESTVGNHVPPTPTKLGLYPKYKPEIYTDNTLLNPVDVIQGHDGSIMVAYDDYRDDLLLELEKRIYNNIKISYDTDIRNIFDFVPGENRNTGYNINNINQSMAADFIRWNSMAGTLDYTDNFFYDSTDNFTYNHSHMLSFAGTQLPGFWRAIYKQAYDTDRPHSHPWEMLGFSLQPTWWNQVYGPAPYTRDNLILWEDIQAGVIREPGKKLVYDSRYKRTDLMKHLPVDEDGALLSPINSNYAKNLIVTLSTDQFKYGDQAPVETAWRRSSNYPFALLKSMLLNRPAHTMGVNFDASRIQKNITNEIVYTSTKKRITLSDLIFPNSRTDENLTLTSGLINYVSNYIKTDVLNNYTDYQTALKELTQQLGFKVKGFTEKEKFKLLLDSRSPLNKSNVFVPEENYDIHLNTSSPIDVLVYSGVIVEKLPAGFLVKGYDTTSPQFKYFTPLRKQNDPVKRVGGVSQSFIKWISDKVYTAGQIVQFQNQFYQTKIDHLSASKFDVTKFTKLVSLPMEGGVTAVFSKNFQKTASVLNYGTVLATQQEVVDFILGYGKYLESKGFVFDNFNRDINTVENWGLSAQEFMFWTTQNWKAGAVLSMSPSANKLKLQTSYSIADNVFDNFYDYAVLKADGTKITRDKLSVVRENNDFTLSVKNTSDGIYFVNIPLIQKEHVVLIDNVTVFNDVIYDQAPGYRQDRIKVIGYVVSDWNGSLNIPGFVYDEVTIKEWQTFTDYNMSDVVKHKQFYYSANNNITGTNTFNDNEWSQLAKKPISSLKPNFEYKTNQFGDFYDLDTDNFDVEQQKLAQHLIGYQKREYLQNIINDDVAQYKFYQGFLQDKGTKNALSKLFDSLASANKDSIEFYEEWAIRTGQYGASKGFDEVEYLLDETQFKLNPQPIALTNSPNPADPDFVYRIKSDQTYLTSENYTHNPFPLKTQSEEYIKTAGFVDPADVNFILKYYDDILNINTAELKFDQYVWIGFYKQSWQVYKYVKTEYKVLTVSEANDLVTVTTDVYSNVTVDDIISVTIPQQNSVQLFKVKSVSLDQIVCHKNGDTVLTANDGSSYGYLGIFVSNKIANLELINAKASEQQGFKDNDLFWVENNNQSDWVTLKNKKVFALHQNIANFNTDSDGTYGTAVAVNSNNNIMAVSDLNQGIYVYQRGSNAGQFTLRQVIDVPQNIWTGTADFGAALDISPDGKYIVVGAPKASNVKTYYKGLYDSSTAYNVGDIVQHNEQLWQVSNPVLGADPSVDFTTFDAASFWSEAEFDVMENEYPIIKQMITGNYTFVGVGTDHILIRASTDQYRGSAVGDTLVLYWNNLTTEYPTGNVPFNGAAIGIDKTFIDGAHTIQEKVDEIISIDLLIITPTVGDTLNTDDAVGTVSYIFAQGTQAIIYLSNVEGNLANADQIRLGPIPVGDYVRAITEDYNSVAGWWKIDVPSPGTTSDKADSKRSLVVRDIIKAGDPRTAFLYFNSLDTQLSQSVLPTIITPASQLSILTYNKQNIIPGYSTFTGIINDSRYLIRAPKAMSDALPTATYDEVGVWFNSIQTGTPLSVIEPTALDLPFADLNGVKEIIDVWNGFLRVLAQPDGLGLFYVPTVGDTVQDDATGSQAEVAYVKVIGFNQLQIYIKNKTGSFSAGTDFGLPVNLILIGTPNRTVGVIQRSELEDAVVGSLFVFDRGIALTPISSSAYHFLNGLEYYLYQDITQDGVSRSASVPSSVNRDYTQVFNIPAGLGYPSVLTNQGLFLVYERLTNGNYVLNSSYIVPEQGNNTHLGSKIIIRQKDAVTTLYVSSTVTATDSGKIYFIKKSSTQNWHLSVDPHYTGLFDPSRVYYTNDLVAYNDVIFKSLTNQGPSAFIGAFWEEQSEGVDYLGFVPNNPSDDSTPTLMGDSTVNINQLQNFGYTFDVNDSGSVLAVSVIDFIDSSTPTQNKVVVYRLVSGRYQYSQTLTSPDSGEDNTAFANNVSISSDGMFIAVGSPQADQVTTDAGVVYVYKQVNGVYMNTQTLTSPQPQITEKFGTNLDFDGDTLIISSLNGDMEINFSLDNNNTYFDAGATTFNSKILDTGSVYVYENYNDIIIYADEFSVNDLNLTNFGKNIKIVDNHVYVSMPNYLNNLSSPITEGLIFNFRKPNQSKTWAAHKSPMGVVDINKIKEIFLYNTKNKKLLQRLDYVDPVQGKIAGIAEQELYYKTSYDPAIYSIGTAGLSVDANNTWDSEQVGRLWWDLSTVKFYLANQNNIIFATNYWNKIFPGSSVDVYEWVESKYLPQEWNTLSQNNTPAAVNAGISGTTKYNNSVYVVKQVYDFISNSFSNKYYYWVKNKQTLPNVEGRKLNAYDVSRLIEDPRKQSYRFVALLSTNQFAVNNVNTLLENKDVAINFKVWTIDNQNINIHNEYQLISDGVNYSRPKTEIEAVWFNSLIGYDEQFRSVPDENLSAKYRYGTLRKPRQGWFVNRIEALKQTIERINSICKKNLIAYTYDISRLSELQAAPSIITRLYDLTKDTFADLAFVGTANVEQAVLNPIIVEGRIVDVFIANPGRGYRVIPTYKIVDPNRSGTDAEFTLEINLSGQITSVTVNKQGSNYSANTRIEVRKFSVLIQSDSVINGKWSVHNWDNESEEWQRILSQSYNVNQYWNYVDWYVDGYNQFTEIDYTISDSYKLQLLDDDIGDIVKIETVGTGGWLLLEKTDNQENVDYTVNYKTIGRQNGTIQFSSVLYNFAQSTVGFNSTSYDVSIYDNQPITETRIILETIRDYIFVDELEIEYNQLFFANLRYVFSEQSSVDWAFKTSFVKGKHNVGELLQKTLYRNDNLENYQDYINEVKPYKTKVREYISAYESIDNSATSVTDFDLPATYNPATKKIEVSYAKVINNQIVGSNLTNAYPNQHWLNNVGFKIIEIKIFSGGSGYLGTPVITITGGGGTGATAQAFVTNGRVTKIKLINQGSGYVSAPTVNIQGTLNINGVPAKAVAVLGDSLIKSTHIRVKFDRTTGSLLITNLSRTENFVGTGNRLKFQLKWPINLKSNKITVIVNQRTALFSEYVYNNEEDNSLSYLRSKGFVTFNQPPMEGSAIQIQYEIDSNVLQTQDRVNLLYEPTIGQLGQDLAQLIDGIDYGGVEVRSLDFGGGTGWDAEPYFSTTWDTYDTTFEDEVFRLDGSTNTFNLSQPLAAGVNYNIYKNGVRIDDPNYGTLQPVTNPNALMQTIVGDGSTTVIQIDEQVITTVANDLIVIRKSTSDGSFLPDPDAYDTLLSGGNLAYSTATGILAQDIIVDGDGFVTPTTSKGPEELVPGQVLDTVDIQVYDRSGETGSRINSYNHKGDGITDVFVIDTLPQSQEAVFVKVNNQILDNSAFTTNFANKTVVLNSVPANNTQINIITMSINGEKIVDTDVFTGDGSTFIFVTRAVYDVNQIAYVKVNGQFQTYVTEATDSGYQYVNRTLIKFAVPPAVGSVITYVIYNSISKSFSEVTYDDFIGDGSTAVFTLSTTPFNQEPLTHNVIVKVGNNILNAGYNERFNVTAVREYALNSWQQPFGTVVFTDVRVFLNGVELISPQYTWNSPNSSVILEAGVGTVGDVLKVYVISDGDYTVVGNVLTLDTAPAISQTIKVWQFTNHDVLEIERINYDVIARDTLVVNTENYFEYQNLTNGIVRLRQNAADAQYVWVSVNGVMLAPSVDYKVSNDQQYLKIKKILQQNDVLDIVHFTAPKYTAKFGFRQFKDMLNRTTYKRLGNDNKYFLAQNLNYSSQEIFLDSTEGLTVPNPITGRPGVLFIEGERIEYFLKYNNRVGQLRRGTLGTGIKSIYDAGTEVFDQSASQTVPYKDEIITEIFTSDGSTENITLSWMPLSANEFEVFVNGRRLRKNSISSYNVTLGMDSPEADVVLPAEFSVTGTTTTCTLLVAPPINTKIIVVRKIGKLWNADTPLSQTENDIARFLRAKEVSLPQ
jgi:hypothetical protein